jgi:hypothetical protein
VLVTEGDPDALTSDRHILRVLGGAAYSAVCETRGDLDAFHAADVEQRQALPT